jgi:type III secretory pathway component EscT
MSNGLWLTFPLWGMYAAVTMIDESSYALFWR